MIEGRDYKIPVTFIIVGSGNIFFFIEHFYIVLQDDIFNGNMQK